MSDIIDVIHRLSYQVDSSPLNQALASINNQVQSIAILSNRLSKLQQLYNSTSSDEIQKRQRIAGLIAKQNQLIEQTTQGIAKEVQQNKQLQQAIVNEIGLINTLSMKQRALTEERNRSNDPAKIRAFNRELAQTNKQLASLTGTGSAVGGIGQSILSGLGLGAGFGIASLVGQGIGEIRQFAAEASSLAAETEGVERAFDRLNNPTLLDELRSATKGTVSDLELMKNAVQFSNFGLPVEKLGIALSFARQRAADTGQSVDYLVQSIVTGIGRQSPLILDNLGINAKRVADEFKQTGNFAEAAFKIIQEEAQKATSDLETYAEQQARVNATIQNAQAGFGKYYNEIKGFLFALGKDILTGAALTENTFTDTYINAQRQAREGARQLQDIQTNANILYLQGFKQFTEQYKKADYGSREVVKLQAKTMYDTLYAQGKEFYAKDLKQQSFYLQSLAQAYAQFNAKTKTIPINLNTITEKDISGMTGEQLAQLDDQIKSSRSNLTANDTQLLARYNQLQQIVTKYLNLINGVKDTKAINAAAKAQDNLAEAIEKVQREIGNLDVREYISFLEDLDKETKEKADNIVESLGAMSDSFRSSVAQQYDSQLSKTDSDRLNAQLGIQQASKPAPSQKKQQELAISNLRADRDRAKAAYEEARAKISSARESGATAYNIKQLKENAKEAKNVLREANTELLKAQFETVKQYIAGYETIVNAAVQAFNTISQAQLTSLDAEIEIRRSRVNIALELADKGNTELLQMEEDRLEASIRKREEVARRQQIINSALAVSQAIVAVATTAAESGVAAPVTIAAVIAAIVAGYSLVATATTESSSAAFADGVVGYKGKGGPREDANQVWISSGESIITAEGTAKNRELLEAINKGTQFSVQTIAPNPYVLRSPDNIIMNNGFATKGELKGLESKLDTLIEAVNSNGTTVHANVDERGLSLMTVKQIKRDQNRFR